MTIQQHNNIIVILPFWISAAKGVSSTALATGIAKYVAANGLPLTIARVFSLDCYWEEIPHDEL